MKKYLLSSMIAVVLATGGAAAQTATTDPGVVINGVKWATRNVDAVGTFANTPESTGMFYQWNRNVAWTWTGTGWDTSIPTGTEWESANDPSPAGWRMPTLEEFQSLLDPVKVQNVRAVAAGIGILFTDLQNNNTLFIPNAGYLDYRNGTLNVPNLAGNYWSSKQDDSNDTYAAYLHFNTLDDNNISTSNLNRTYGFSVRPVKINDEITGFAPLADIDGGTTYNPTYTDATAVIAALPASVIANYSGGSILWSVSTWADTDNYNPAVAGTYAFTAVSGKRETAHSTR